MPPGLEISLSPERLDEGSAEERAAFGLFAIRTPQACLTEGFDHYINAYRPGPLVSGYHAAVWFAWNWWRLRWEPRSDAAAWDLAHRMTSIGEGYLWPNLAIFSDGERTSLVAEPSSRPDARPFRFVGARPAVVPAAVFEAALDGFMAQIIARVRDRHGSETDLDRLWREVLAERGDPETARHRRIEALLGRDPDEVDDGAVGRLLADADDLGAAAIEEIAADHAQTGGAVPGAGHFEALARDLGHDAAPGDAIRLPPGFALRRGPEVPAWRLGAAAAQALRRAEQLGEGPVGDARLARMAGVAAASLSGPGTDRRDISFALDRGPGTARIVLRPAWHTGRRFDLARLIGDRLMSRDGALHPATRAYTYRQQAQRSFAAELLSPFEAVEAVLAGDYSQERQQDTAEYFEVSSMTINAMLKNHGRLRRDEPEPESDPVIVG